MAPKTKTAPATTAGVSIKIPRSSYRALQRLAKSEQRTITATVERAIERYRATVAAEEGKTK